MLSHLIYISFRDKNCTEEDISNILKSCQANNKHDDITGVLLYSDIKFLQYLEGDYEKILSLFNKIKEDKRHSNVVMLTSFPIKERAFPSWQMGSKFINFENIDFRTDISETDQNTFKDVLSGKTNNQAIPVIQKLFK